MRRASCAPLSWPLIDCGRLWLNSQRGHNGHVTINQLAQKEIDNFNRLGAASVWVSLLSRRSTSWIILNYFTTLFSSSLMIDRSEENVISHNDKARQLSSLGALASRPVNIVEMLRSDHNIKLNVEINYLGRAPRLTHSEKLLNRLRLGSYRIIFLPPFNSIATMFMFVVHCASSRELVFAKERRDRHSNS